jgi:DNA repair protein RadC
LTLARSMLREDFAIDCKKPGLPVASRETRSNSPRWTTRTHDSEATNDAVIRRALRIMESRLKYRELALSSPLAVRDYLRLRLADREWEVFVVLFLDAQNRLIACEEMFRGTLTQTSVYPREVVKAALKHNAAAVIFAHNHPSGLPEPSRADELLTSALKQALALVDCKTLDHFIVAGDKTISFAERGLL